jgi:hypothetical protein
MIKNFLLVLCIVSSCSSPEIAKIKNNLKQPKSENKENKNNVVFGKWHLDSMTYLGINRTNASNKEFFLEYLSDYRFFVVEKNEINEKSKEIGTYEYIEDTLKIYTRKGILMQKHIFSIKDNKLVLNEIDVTTNKTKSIICYLTKNNTNFLDTDF